MKSIKKYLFILAALAAVLSAVSCKNDDDSSSDIVFTNGSGLGETQLVFSDDGTWKQFTVIAPEPAIASGTYTGDPASDGDIEYKFSSGLSGGTWTIKDGKITIGSITYTRK